MEHKTERVLKKISERQGTPRNAGTCSQFSLEFSVERVLVCSDYFIFICFFIFILLTLPDFLAGKLQQRRPITAVP